MIAFTLSVMAKSGTMKCLSLIVIQILWLGRRIKLWGRNELQTAWGITIHRKLYAFYEPRSKTEDDCWAWFGGVESFWDLNRQQLEAKGFTCVQIEMKELDGHTH